MIEQLFNLIKNKEDLLGDIKSLNDFKKHFERFGFPENIVTFMKDVPIDYEVASRYLHIIIAILKLDEKNTKDLLDVIIDDLKEMLSEATRITIQKK